METISIIKRFIESNWIIEKAVREVLERLPLKFRYGISYGPTFRYWLAFLKESEKWDRERLEAYQLEQLKDLLIHAGKNITYYRDIFQEYGFKPESLQSFDDIRILPFIDRKTVKDNYEAFIASNIPKTKLIPTNTSGTSGIPLAIYGTKETEEKHWATIIDLWSRAGYSPASRAVFIEANVRAGKGEGLPYKKFGNRLIISSNYFTKQWIYKYVNIMNKFRPECIIGLPTAVTTFASHLKKTNQSINSIKKAILYSENVYTWQRKIIMEAMEVRVFADYGMVEKVIHGGGCEFSNVYHIYPQYGYTEYLNIQPHLYELVGTGFINYAMPLIRYKTGDTAKKVAPNCNLCGRNHEITEIQGRTCDFLINADSQIVSVYIDLNAKTLKNIDRFQLYQERPGNVELRIWPRDYFKSEDGNKLLSEIKRSLGFLGKGIKFDVSLIEENQLKYHGKYRMVEQRLDIRDFLK